MTNVLNWFEIPVANLPRAKTFYSKVLQADLREENMGEIQMAILPYSGDGVGGALVAGPYLQPSDKGTVIYLNDGADLAEPLERVESAGGKVVMPKTHLSDEIGYIAMFIDTEGNRVALHSPAMAR